MKRAIRLVGVLALGASAVGCGAEQGSDENAGASIEQKSQALVTPIELKDSASCKIRDTSLTPDKDVMLVFGGFDPDGIGVVVTKAYIYEPGVGFTDELPGMDVARTKAKALNLPGTDQCIVVGGEEADGDAVTATEIFDLSDWRANNANGWIDLNGGSAGKADTSLRARTDFSLIQCGTSTVIAVGGRNDSAANNPVTQIEYWTGTAWTDLVTASGRFQGAIAALDTNYAKFVMSGGRDDSSAYLNTLDVLTVNGSCASPTLTQNPGPTMVGNSTTLQTARKRLVAFPADNGSTNTFIFAGGELSGPTMTGDVDRVTVTWNNPPTVKVETLSDLTTPRADIALTAYGADYVLAGGQGASGAETEVQFWDTGTPGLVAEDSDDFLTNARYRSPIEYLTVVGGTSQAWIYGGIGTSGTILGSVEDVTDNP